MSRTECCDGVSQLSGIVVSIPRSGFHLYERIVVRYLLASGVMTEYLGHVACDQMAVRGALSSVPISREGGKGLVLNLHLRNVADPQSIEVLRQVMKDLDAESTLWFTKAHDSSGTLPVMNDVNTVVLIRDPFHQMLSNFWAVYVAPSLSDGPNQEVLMNRDNLPEDSVFLNFFKSNLAEYGRFYKKWISASVANRKIIPYESTLLSPVVSASCVINWLFPNVAINYSLLAEICASVESEVSIGPNTSDIPNHHALGVKLSVRAELLSRTYRGVLSECAGPLADALSIDDSPSSKTDFHLGRYYFDALMGLREGEFSIRFPDEVRIL